MAARRTTLGLTRARQCAAMLAIVCLAPLSAAHARLIDAVDIVQSDAHIDLLVQFTCALRYAGHAPSAQGAALRVRLVPSPTCAARGDAPPAPERPTSPDPAIVESILLEETFAPELALTVQWRGEEKYVLAPAADLTGLRIRLLRPGREKSRVYITEDVGSGAVYAVNLDSATSPHDATALAQARERLGVAPYESQLVLNDVTWHRLRVGPFATRAEAERVLAAARASYPRAWLAIDDDPRGDDAVTSDVAPTRTRADAPQLSASELTALFEQSRSAMQRRNYPEAIGLLTRLVEQPEHAQRADALELLGLARERHRQLAHAKAEYEEYLRAYPQAAHAARVRQRLRALVSATRRGPDGRVVIDDRARSPWRTHGGVALRYQRDTNQIETQADKLDFTAQNSAISDFDAVARRKGERFDFLGRTNFGYQKDLLDDGSGDRTRVSAAYADLSDREHGWSTRWGRQSRSAGGLPGAFDGVAAAYQWSPGLRINGVYGYPIESSYDSLQRERSVYGLSLDMNQLVQRWDVSVYGLEQRVDGVEDRRAVGAEAHYFQPGRTFVGLIDYDVSYQQINSAILLGTFELPARWTASINVDHRASPMLSTRNALIGQPVEELDALRSLFTEEELRALAEDRTATSDTYSVSLSRPLNAHVQMTADVTSSSTSATDASAGVAAIDASEFLSYTLQLLGGGWIRSNDFHLLGVRYQTADSATLTSLTWYTRFPVGQSWRIGPRFRVNQQQLASNTELLSYGASLRVDLLGRRSFALFEAGAELGERTRQAVREDSTRYYFSAEYRWTF